MGKRLMCPPDLANAFSVSSADQAAVWRLHRDVGVVLVHPKHPLEFFVLPPDIHVAVFYGDLRAAIARSLSPRMPAVVPGNAVLNPNFNDDREQLHVIAGCEFSKLRTDGVCGVSPVGGRDSIWHVKEPWIEECDEPFSMAGVEALANFSLCWIEYVKIVLTACKIVSSRRIPHCIT